MGQTAEARGVAVDALDRYRGNFGVRHPLTLVAAANVAIILRASGMTAQARALNEHTLDAMTDVLGPEHPYTLCVQSNLANDLAALGDAAAARSLAERTLAASRRVRGDAHPYTLACAVNAGIDRQASGDAEGGRRLLDEALVPLGEALGARASRGARRAAVPAHGKRHRAATDLSRVRVCVGWAAARQVDGLPDLPVRLRRDDRVCALRPLWTIAGTGPAR